ncbi:TonB-dependent receptor [Sphingomonas hylomeconis]|uniref:TonB-dependent receptor n=1 Tax=Sphingomonas hylomeconis TaxID=1395958 RepID=A0ABV7SWE0_9SPHN|nr:TonB-dependent receptor [Sphingomonas hylomeconis]
MAAARAFAVAAPLLLALPSAAAAQSRRFDVPAQPAASALPIFARQAGLQILAPASALDGIRTQRLRGTYPLDRALTLLIADTPLRVRSRSADFILLERIPPPAPPPAPPPVDEPEIVVTASIFRNQDAITARRRAATTVDTLTQDDTGDLAEQSIADALARVPGVSTMQVLYAEQESEYVTVRGITPDLNFVSVDGIGMISLANAGAGERRIDLALIPKQSARTTEVHKSFTADMDAGAIGGLINLVPHSAFDPGNRPFFIDTSVNYHPNNAVPAGRSRGRYRDVTVGGGANALWATRFGANHDFGVVLAANFQQRSYDDTKRNPNGRNYYKAAGARTRPDSPDWNGYQPSPTALVSYDFTSFVRTYGGSALLEYKPSERTYASLMLYGYRQEEDQNENSFTLRAFDTPRDLTPTSGTLNVPDARTAYAWEAYRNTSLGAIAKAVTALDERTELTLRAGYVQTGFDETVDTAVYQYLSHSDIRYDASRRSLRFTLADPVPFVDPANYRLFAASDATYHAIGRSAEARADLAYNAAPEDRGLGFKTGAGVRRMHLSRNVGQASYVPDQSQLTPVAYNPHYVPWMFDYPVLWIDYPAFRDTVRPGLAIDPAASAASSAAQDYRYTETIAHAYALASYASDHLALLAGLRLDDTRFTAAAPSTGAGSTGALQRYAGGYRYLLPSANLAWTLVDPLRLKASYSRTLGRPAPENIAQVAARDPVMLTLRLGNPDLKPRRADNLDLGLEYYFGSNDGLLTIGAFAKTIRDDIYEVAREAQIDGAAYTVFQPMNAQRSRLRGIELNLIQNQLPLLGGRLGASVNAMRTWGAMDYLVGGQVRHLDRLLFQRDWIANAALFYALPRGGELRLGYNYRSSYYDGIGENPWQDRGPEASDSVDVTLRYRVAKRWIVKLQALNLAGRGLRLGYGEDLAYRRAELTPNRSFFFNLVYKP